MVMNEMTSSELKTPKQWQILADATNAGEARRKYLEQCSIFEIAVRKLIKQHQLEIKRAKAHLGKYPKTQHWHFSCRLAKQQIKKSKFEIILLRKFLPSRKSVWTSIKEFFRKWYLL